MPTTIEAQGRTIDEAIQIALNQLGASRDKVEIEIVHHPRRGFLGIGARRAKVRATLRQGIMLDGEEFDMSGGTLQEKPRRRRRRGGKGRSGRGENEPESGSTEREPDRDRPREGDRGRRGGERQPERGRDDRRGRDGQTAPREERRGRGEPQRGRDDARAGGRADQRDQREPRDQRDRDRRGQQGPGGGRSRGGPAQDVPQTRPDRAEPAAAPIEVAAERQPEQTVVQPQRPAEAAYQTQVQETLSREVEPPAPQAGAEPLDAAAIRDRAQELVSELISTMGFSAEVTSWVDDDAHEIVVSVRSESEGLLIGRRGQTLDAIEHVINRTVLRGEGTGDGRVLLDIGDYRRRRRETLVELAERLRTRALGEQRTVQVSPMSPRDRKFFQQALAADPAVEVRALGAGFYRRMVVAPAGLGPAALAEAAAPEPSFADEDDAADDVIETFSPGEPTR